MDKVLIIDSGARGDALAWKLAQSPHVGKIWRTVRDRETIQRIPSEYAQCIPIQDNETERLVDFAYREKPNLIVIGPETVLQTGIVDTLQRGKFRVFGPGRDAARIETSKIFAKDLMREHGIPTAPYHVGRSLDEAAHHVLNREPPCT